MPIAFDATSPDTYGLSVAALTSASWTIAGANRVALGFAGIGSGSPGTETVTMKWGGSGGTALTQIGSYLNIGSFARLSAHRLIAPTAQASTAYASFSATEDEAAIGMVSYTGVDQTTPVGTPVTAVASFGTSGLVTPTVNVTTVVGDIVIACIWVLDGNGNGPQASPNGGATTRYDMGGTNTNFECMCVFELTASGTTTTMSANVTPVTGNMQGDWGIMAFVLTPGGGGGGGGSTLYPVDIGSTRNRPGRGPYSLGRFFRPSIDAFSQFPQSYSVSLAESVNATDLLTAVLSGGASLSEVISAADVVSALVVLVASRSEANSTTDVITSLLSAVGNLTEAASVAELISSTLAGVAALAESVSTSDSISAGATSYSVALSETGSASDTPSSSEVAVAAISETTAVADAISSIATFARSLSEAATATESMSSTGQVYGLSIVESMSLSESLASALQGASVLSEIFTATESLSTLAALNGAMADAIAVVDALSSGGSVSASLVEATAVADFLSILSRGLPPSSRVFAVPMRDRVIVIQSDAPNLAN